MLISSPGSTHRDHLRIGIEDALRRWGRTHTQELLDFEKQMDFVRKTQDRRGFSKGGDQALYGEIPVSLHDMISLYVGSPNWHHDPATRETFWSMFQVGKIRKGAGLPKHE